MPKRTSSYSSGLLFHAKNLGLAIAIESVAVVIMIILFSVLPSKVKPLEKPTIIQLLNMPEKPKQEKETPPAPPSKPTLKTAPASKPIIKAPLKSDPDNHPPIQETAKITPIPEPLKVPEPSTPPSPFLEKPAELPVSVKAPTQPVNEADILMDYTTKIRAAVQSALVFPKMAEAMDLTGRTRVEFTLFQGQQSQAKIITSSGVNMFDRAALQAVIDATYPPLPDNLKSQPRTFAIWVEFNKQ